MGDLPNSLNQNSSILVSRNRPLAFIVGVAGFLGSHLAEELLSKNIQVVGVDDMSFGVKENLKEVVKDKSFHFVNRSIVDPVTFSALSLPRIDYVFFVADSDQESLFTQGLLNFLNFVQINTERITEEFGKDDGSLKNDLKGKPRIVFVSSVNLYGNKLSSKEKILKEGEIRFARFIKYHKLNGRIVRTSALYGPRMHFREEEPVVKLIQAELLEELQKVPTSTDFSTRSLFIDDAVKLIMRSAISGSTAQKIYDGSLLIPIKIADIKQILLDPLWHEEKHFSPGELPPWPTPNLMKTMKELSWQPKTHVVEALKKTVAYFKDSGIEIPELEKEELKFEGKRWSFAQYEEGERVNPSTSLGTGGEGGRGSGDDEGWNENKEERKGKGKKGRDFKGKLGVLVIILLIGYGLFYPVGKILWGGFSIRNDLKQSSAAIREGDFAKARERVEGASSSLRETRQAMDTLQILKKVGVLSAQIDEGDQLLSLMEDGIAGVDQAIVGTQALFQTTKIISGEKSQDPKPLFETAQTNLTAASQKIARVKASLDDKEFVDSLPSFMSSRVVDLSSRLGAYTNLVEKARAASFLLPDVLAVDGKKSYLVLLENNLELRGSGGFIGSYARLTFEKGRIADIKVDDIYNLDGGLKEVIQPPAEIKNDLGVDKFYLRDSNVEPDFPTSARQAEFFYNREAGERVNGVFALDLSASGKLIQAVGGLDLPEYGEHIDEGNLFEKAIAHAEVNFFPGSQAKKNYLTSLENQLFNKLFYLSKQNWPAIIEAVSDSLEQKHLMVYLSDPKLFSYLASENWAGVMPRGVEEKAGQTNDFLASVEANYGANKSNYYLDRSYKLETSFGKNGEIYHKLTINYRNNSPSEVFPAGKYKNRFKVYLPLGSKLNKASFGEDDISKQFTSFVDYGRTGYSVLIELMPKDQKSLVLDYEVGKPLNFKEGKVQYRMNVIKQAGTLNDTFDFVLAYPINYKLDFPEGQQKTQEVEVSTDLLRDRSFLFNIQNTAQ